jgi:hypothetical protein
VHPHPHSSADNLCDLRDAKSLSEWHELAIAAYAFAGAGTRVPSVLAIEVDKEGSDV